MILPRKKNNRNFYESPQVTGQREWKMKYKYPVVVSWPKKSVTYLSNHNLKNPISKPFSRRPMLVLPLNSDFAPPSFSLFSLPPTIIKVRWTSLITRKFLSSTPAWNESLSESSLSLCLSLSLLYILWAQIRATLSNTGFIISCPRTGSKTFLIAYQDV